MESKYIEGVDRLVAVSIFYGVVTLTESGYNW